MNNGTCESLHHLTNHRSQIEESHLLQNSSYQLMFDANQWIAVADKIGTILLNTHDCSNQGIGYRYNSHTTIHESLPLRIESLENILFVLYVLMELESG